MIALDALTDQQREAVESTASRIVVMAAAGSGKTHVLVERAVHLIQQRGVSAQDVLLVTFTRKAAREISDRIAKRVGPVDGTKVWCDTFHAIALRMLNLMDGTKLSVITPKESTAFFLEVCHDLGFNSKQTSDAKRAMKELTQGGTMVATKLSMTAFDEFSARMNRMGCVDYGILLLRCFNRYCSISPTFRHVLVDEAQDCDAMQWKFVNAIANHDLCAGLMVVGDPNQTIYEWRGGSARFMYDMVWDATPDARVIRLSETFRCGDAIAEAATRLIRNNKDGYLSSIEKTDVRGTVEICKADLTRDPDGDFDDPWIEFADDLRRSDNKQTFAVLCRTNCEADEIDRLLSSMGVKTYRAGHTAQLSADPGFRKAWAILSLAWNPANDIAFNVLVPDLDIDPTALSAIRESAARAGKSLWATYLVVVPGKTALRYMIEKICEAKCGDSMMDYVYDLLFAAEAHSSLKGAAIKPHDGTDKLLQAMELIDEDDCEIPDGAVYVGTIHGAKGLEFDNVCVVNCELGRFPRDGEANLEAERRLMYVAMTRARYSLVLHYQRDPSMFVTEALPDAV